MQIPERSLSIRKSIDPDSGEITRHVFTFPSKNCLSMPVLCVDVYWHISKGVWGGNAFYYGDEWDKSIYVEVTSVSRRNITKLLRVAIAEKRNPKLREVREQLDGSAAHVTRVAEALKKHLDQKTLEAFMGSGNENK